MSTAAGSRKAVRSASAVITGTESGQHLLKMDGYSRTKDEFPTGRDIESRSFHVGGHSWFIRYYSNGSHSENADSISIFLQLKHNATHGVKAHFTFTILNYAGRPSYTGKRLENIFHDSGWGERSFIKRDELEKSGYLWYDCLTIICDLTVYKELETNDIDHLGGLLATGEGVDVTFKVDGKTFVAHGWVLAARSPLFRSEFFGPEKARATTDSATDIVHINDMEAQDFEALLCYMYTDCLPERKGGEAVAMLPDLVAAANRYKIERLRLLCEQKLCEYVNERTVVAMLAFAEEHHCNGLKEKCLHILDNPTKLREILKAEGLENLIKNYPYIFKDVIAKLAVAPV
ncbi:hypothetical protein E2562_023154 [Oryza meyeriana var. granulata]|uniref:BTB domain-containing protein n=1 Tax=Oryza meyeriana var. granulata TaxID=110450 RepID=A0A6G1C0H8_9ORYZ|nr:hypothetical protein E2562_023154 [Oryza meyeriana var. granulata]